MPVYGGIGHKGVPDYIGTPVSAEAPPLHTPDEYNKYLEPGTYTAEVARMHGTWLSPRVVSKLAKRHGFLVPDLQNAGVVDTSGSADHASLFDFIEKES